MTEPDNNKPKHADPAFMAKLLASIPVTPDAYYVVTEQAFNNRLACLALTPIYTTMLGQPVLNINSTVGQHRFIAKCDQPVLLLPLNEPEVDQHGQEPVKIELGLDREAPDTMLITYWYQYFDPATASAAQLKIEAGNLYKKINNKWTLFNPQ